jgi:hypothetical protein
MSVLQTDSQDGTRLTRAPTRQKPSTRSLSDGEVLNAFTVNTGLIAAMDLGDEDDATAGPSAAFAHRS